MGPDGVPRVESVSGTAQHRNTSAPTLKVAVAILVIGAVLAVAAAFGPVWVIRAGIALAIAGGVIALVLAGRVLVAQRRDAAVKSLAAVKAHGQALSVERGRNAEVVETLSKQLHMTAERLDAARAEADHQRTTIAGLRGQLSTLRGDNAALRAAIARRESELSGLRATIARLESELAAARAERPTPGEETAEVDDQVVAMPRRVQKDDDRSGGWDAVPTAAELWSDGDHPTVVDLTLLEQSLFSGDERKHA